MARNRARNRGGQNYTFSQVPKADIPRSSFTRNHTHKTTFDAGYLVPIYVDEVLPGDTFNLKMDVFGRLATPIFPIMDGVYLESFFFFVPNRLIWDNWQKFMGEQKNPGDSTDFLIPLISDSSEIYAGSIGDYFGLPVAKSGLEINALPFRAYNLIWNEWFRDENLQDSLTVNTGNGPDATPSATYTIQRRGKRHDYFTSCLPWPQKGPGAEIPIAGGTAPLVRAGTGAPQFAKQDFSGMSNIGSNTGGQLYVDTGLFSTSPMYWGDPALVADLSGVTMTTINALRIAFQIQKLMERDARGGTRYTEILRSHFGVISPDARLQRPEYLGGGHSPLIINPVTQTSGSPGTGGYTATPQGNLAAYGVIGGRGHGFTKSFTEHGYVIGLICARADISYQQGLHKLWSRQTKYDFYWPALSHIGEQAVLNREIYAQGSAGGTADEEVFGYQERWSEYRYGISKITGKLRSTDPQSLDAWHLSQEFSALPTLSDTFIVEDPPLDRCIAVQTEPHFIFDSYFKINCVRPMPVYSVPGMIDHF